MLTRTGVGIGERAAAPSHSILADLFPPAQRGCARDLLLGIPIGGGSGLLGG
jgi:hypothetical protein